MRSKFFALLFAMGLLACGCTVQVPVRQTLVAVAPASVHPLPFTGRLVSGNVDQLPPAVAISLSPDSPIAFSYREELTHDEYHIPLVISALDPVTYFGAPLGDYGVTAFAQLSIFEGDKVLGDYTAKAFVSKSYSLYAEPTHQQLEEAARTAVREKIDQRLRQDETRLAQAAAVAASAAPAAP